MIRLEGSYTFDAPRDVVWELLQDPDVLSKALPGVQSLEQIGENQYRGVLNIRVGPVQGRFQGTVTMTDIRPPEGYHLVVEGKGPQGFMKGEGDLKLTEAGEKTELTYTVDAQVGGRIAAVGQRLIESTAKSLVRQALDSLNRQAQARMRGPEPAEAPTPSVESSSSSGAETSSASAPPPEIETPSMAQVTVEVVRDVMADMIPEEQRPMILAAVVGFFAFLVGWLLGRSEH